MRREGSPWQGLGAVMLKELADHLSSARMRVLEWLVVLTAAAALYGAIDRLRETVEEDPFLLLRLFTVDRAPLPSFVAILGFLIPLMAIGLGFDAINGEHNRRTLARVLAQPIYRDALLAGKFLAAFATLAISLLCLWLLVVGLGVFLLGVPPGGGEIVRSLVFLAFTLAYAAVWLALAMLCSILFRSAATAALVTLGIWLFLSVLWPMLAPAAGADHRAVGSPLAAYRRSEPADARMAAGPRTPVAQSSLWGDRAGGVVALHALARSDLPRPATGCGDRRALAAWPEPDAGLAARRRTHRRDDRSFRCRLRRVPTSGGSRLRGILRRVGQPLAIAERAGRPSVVVHQDMFRYRGRGRSSMKSGQGRAARRSTTEQLVGARADGKRRKPHAAKRRWRSTALTLPSRFSGHLRVR